MVGVRLPQLRMDPVLTGKPGRLCYGLMLRVSVGSQRHVWAKGCGVVEPIQSPTPHRFIPRYPKNSKTSLAGLANNINCIAESFTCPHVCPSRAAMMGLSRAGSYGISAEGSRKQILLQSQLNRISRFVRRLSGDTCTDDKSACCTCCRGPQPCISHIVAQLLLPSLLHTRVAGPHGCAGYAQLFLRKLQDSLEPMYFGEPSRCDSKSEI